MLNLRPIFQDAIDVLSGYASQLKLPALPATVFLMQQDALREIDDAFKREGIDYVLIKGAANRLLLYSNPTNLIGYLMGFRISSMGGIKELSSGMGPDGGMPGR